MKTTILKNEFWYGGAVYEGYRQPVGADDIVDWDFRENPTHNQIMPLFLSSKGRYIWSDAGFHISFRNGEILAEGPEPIILKDGFNDLRGAYLAAMESLLRFFCSEFAAACLVAASACGHYERCLQAAQDEALQ